MTFYNINIKSIKVDDVALKIKTEDEKKYDFLDRYIRARKAIAEYEWERDHTHDKTWYFKQADRDIMRFCQILNEVIGERE